MTVECGKSLRRVGQERGWVRAEPPGWAARGKGRNCHMAMMSCQYQGQEAGGRRRGGHKVGVGQEGREIHRTQETMEQSGSGDGSGSQLAWVQILHGLVLAESTWGHGSTFHVPGARLYALCKLSHLILRIPLGVSSHFPEKKMKRRDLVTCPRPCSRSQDMAKQDSSPMLWW